MKTILRAIFVLLGLNSPAYSLTQADLNQADHDLCSSILEVVPLVKCTMKIERYTNLYEKTYNSCNLAYRFPETQFKCLTWGAHLLREADQELDHRMNECPKNDLDACYLRKIAERYNEIYYPAKGQSQSTGTP